MLLSFVILLSPPFSLQLRVNTGLEVSPALTVFMQLVIPRKWCWVRVRADRAALPKTPWLHWEAKELLVLFGVELQFESHIYCK